MATTWMRALHVNKGKTVARTLADRTDYAENPDKTRKGELVTGYGCDPHTADEEFLLAKREYEYITGRNQGRRDVLAYHIRQSFKPGEVSPEEANEIGRKLALSFTKEKHAFIVATHIDRAHTHNHIIFNSTTLDCERKFADFKRSGRAVRRISDLLCAEHGLSVIENPKPSRGRNYGEWLGENKPLSHKQILQRAIDEILPNCATYDDFIARLIAADFEVNTKRKHATAKLPDWGKPARIDTLGDRYTIEAIMARLGMVKTLSGSGNGGTKIRVGLLVDIQAKLQEGKGAGYEHWAHIHNIKQMSKTLLFLKEQGIDSYEELKKKSSSAGGEFAAATKRIKEIETRQKEITELQKYIGQYGKTRHVYEAYRKSGWSRDFYDGHTAEIILCRAAKKYFDAQGFKTKLPSINQLKQEYAVLADERKKLYSGYRELKEKNRSLATAAMNAERILGIAPQSQSHEASRDETR